jgi:hypothetical protein
MEPSAKKPWLSKTIWLNVLGIIGMFIPVIGDYIKANPELVVAFFTIANIALRLISHDKIGLEE